MSICIHQVLYPMYLPAPPALKHTSEQDELEERIPVPRTRIGGSPRTRGPAPAHPPAQPTHTPTHTPGNKSLIPLSTFHFLYSTGTYLLPGTSMYVQYLTVVKETPKIQSKLPTYASTIHTTLPPYLDHRSSLQAVCEKFAQLPCRDDIPSCKSVHHHHHHQTRIRVRRGVPFPIYM